MRNCFLAICMLMLVMGIAGAASALTTLDFEGLPDSYNYMFGGQNIGDYYSGVTFGPGATIADRNRGGYNDNDYPPHSGDAVFISRDYSYVDITFATTVSYVEGWFSFSQTGYLEAYDASGAIVDSDSMAPNYGSNGLMSVSAPDIKWVRIHDHGDFWTGDDIAYGAVPEPSSLLALVTSIGGLGGLMLRRRK